MAVVNVRILANSYRDSVELMQIAAAIWAATASSGPVWSWPPRPTVMFSA